jgi:hypothetical protein
MGEFLLSDRMGWSRTLHFDADRLDVTVPEINLILKCQVQNP